MLQLNNTYNNYLTAHNLFSREHSEINKEIIELYIVPKIFIEENESAMRQFIEKHKENNAPHRAELSARGIRDFLYQIEDFKLQTIELFFEHKAYIEACTAYITRVNKMKTENGVETEYEDLIPVVDELRETLKTLLEKAKDMINQMNKIESRWISMSS